MIHSIGRLTAGVAFWIYGQEFSGVNCFPVRVVHGINGLSAIEGFGVWLFTMPWLEIRLAHYRIP